MKLLSRYLSNTVLIGSVLVGSVLFAQDAKTSVVMPAPKVDVYIVGAAQDMQIPLEYPARITSVKDVTITARVTGVLQKKYYTEGQSVRKGDLLYKIEPDTYAASVESAKANLQLENAKLDKAQKDWDRANGLFKDKAISDQDKDSAFYAYQTAKASANVAKAALHKVSVDLGYTNVRATISGVTGMKMVDVGDLVKEGSAIVSITQTNPIYAEFSIPDISAIKQKYQLQKGNWSHIQSANLKASLIVDGKPYQTLGKIDFVDSRVDKSTSTLKARAVFDNASLSLLSGTFAKVKIMGIVSKNIMTVPQKAVLQNPLGTTVFVVVNGKVVAKPVKILDTAGQNFVIAGVSPRDVVVVNNFFRIKPGASVIIDKTINK